VEVLHNRHPAAGTHKPLRKKNQEGTCRLDFNLFVITESRKYIGTLAILFFPICVFYLMGALRGCENAC
jgi:hypothetical protein